MPRIGWSYGPTPLCKLPWKDEFPFLYWTIWFARNKVALEGTEFNHHQILHRAKSLAIELLFSLPQKTNKSNKSSVLIGLGNPGPASAGSLVRDSDGRWIRGFSRFIGITNSFVAELWGLKDGLNFACNLNICKLIIEIDGVMDFLLSKNSMILIP